MTNYIFNHSYGAFLGSLIGDACGATLEFFNQEITKEIAIKAMQMDGGGRLSIGAGQITDDGELSLSLARALIDCSPLDGLPLSRIGANYIRWCLSNPFDIGNTCRKAFGIRFTQTNDKISLGEYMINNSVTSNWFSESNGSLMRIVPLAIWSVNLNHNLIMHNARMDALLSHPNIICQDCNALYCLTITYLIKHPGDVERALILAEDLIKTGTICEKVKNWFEESKNSLSTFNCKVNVGHVKHAFILAFHFLRKKTKYEEAVLETLMKGGDTDTNCAIVGGMIGALHGINGIPVQMKNKVLSYDYNLKQNNLGYIRPIEYSASFCKILTEKLLTAGFQS